MVPIRLRTDILGVVNLHQTIKRRKEIIYMYVWFQCLEANKCIEIPFKREPFLHLSLRRNKIVTSCEVNIDGFNVYLFLIGV